MKYSCPRCGFITDRKSTMEYHILRKNICDPIIKDVVLKIENIKDYKFNHTCSNCSKTFTKENDYNKHFVFCQKIIVNNNIMFINNGIINNSNVLLPFDKTDLSFMSDDDFYNCFKETVEKGIQKLVKYIHCNENKPENHNISISTLKNDFGYIYRGNSFWERKSQDQVSDEIFNKYAKLSLSWFENTIEQGKGNKIIRFKYMALENHIEQIGVEEQIKKDIKNIFYNHRQLIKRTK